MKYETKEGREKKVETKKATNAKNNTGNDFLLSFVAFQRDGRCQAPTRSHTQRMLLAVNIKNAQQHLFTPDIGDNVSLFFWEHTKHTFR